MNTTMFMIIVTIAMVLVLIATVYAGIYFSRKSAQKRAEIEAKRAKLQEEESKNRRKF